MSRTEKIFYLLLDGFFFLPVFFALSIVLSLDLSIFVAMAVAHTLHWLFNGHLGVLLKNLGFSEIELNCFVKYAERIQKIARTEKSVLAAAIFGSFSKGLLIESSDLDVRILRKSGIVNGFRACMIVFLERSRALIKKFPLDIYVLDSYYELSKLKSNEVPIVLHDPHNVFLKMYNEVSFFNDLSKENSRGNK